MSTLLDAKGNPLDPNDGWAGIDVLIAGIKNLPHWPQVLVKRRLSTVLALVRVSTRIAAIFEGRELPNVKSENGQLLCRLLADAALQVMIQQRLEEEDEGWDDSLPTEIKDWYAGQCNGAHPATAPASEPPRPPAPDAPAPRGSQETDSPGP